ncbi:MAG: molecular chaperone HtpG, partial [Bacteroidales bacterium]|nr:molecular chaperone HtpG [Bacteroidales bacterium]
FIEYGMLSDEKFGERGLKFALVKNTEGKYFSFDEYKKAVEGEQTDKDKKTVFLYATDIEGQYPFIEAAKNKGYDVLHMDCELDSHFVNLLEQKLENVRFARVDSDAVENLIPKEEKIRPEMNEEQRYDLENMFKAVLPEGNDYYVTGDNLGEDADPILITQSEFMRRYREMSALGGGMNFYGELPKSYNITVNMQNPLVAKVMEAEKAEVAPQAELPAEAPESATEEEKTKAREAREAVRKAHRSDIEAFASKNEILHQIADLALLANGMLKGKALSDFIARSRKVVTDAYLK